MTVFNIEENLGVWFDIPTGGRVRLKSPSVTEIFKISRAATKVIPYYHESEKGVGRVLNQEIVDTDQYAQSFHDLSILEWEGLYFDEAMTKEIPCTPENKTLLMRMKDPAFRDFVNGRLEKLDAAVTVQNESEKKT